MIGYLKGKIIEFTEKSVILETNGVGYAVNIYDGVSMFGKEEVELYIETIVREDAIELFGFKEKSTKDFFKMLISVSGIGPKGAMGILSISDVNSLIEAISKNDLAFLTKVSGIGKKTAEKIVIELREKITTLGFQSKQNVNSDIVDALSALGYNQNEIRDALNSLPDDIDKNDIQQIIKVVLKNVRKV